MAWLWCHLRFPQMCLKEPRRARRSKREEKRAKLAEGLLGLRMYKLRESLEKAEKRHLVLGQFADSHELGIGASTTCIRAR